MFLVLWEQRKKRDGRKALQRRETSNNSDPNNNPAKRSRFSATAKADDNKSRLEGNPRKLQRVGSNVDLNDAQGDQDSGQLAEGSKSFPQTNWG